MDQLNNYTDPLTGGHLPADSVFQDPAVHKSLYFSTKNLGWVIAYDNDGDRLPFAPDPDLRKGVKPDQRDVGAKDMATILSRTSDAAKNRGLDLAVLKEYLVDWGYLQTSDGRYTVTPKGLQAGMRSCQSTYGPTVRFAPSAQQLLLDELDDLAEYCVAHCLKHVRKKAR